MNMRNPWDSDTREAQDHLQDPLYRSPLDQRMWREGLGWVRVGEGRRQLETAFGGIVLGKRSNHNSRKRQKPSAGPFPPTEQKALNCGAGIVNYVTPSRHRLRPTAIAVRVKEKNTLRGIGRKQS